MRHIKKLSDYAVATGVGVLLAAGLSGCQQKSEESQQSSENKKGAFVIIEETVPGKYKIKDEFPSDETRIVLKQLDGTEKVLTQEEMALLMKEEDAKIENGTSQLIKPKEEQVASQGMSLGETILASAAGAMVGAWIGNKLFGNQNYQNNRQAGYKSPSTYSKSANSFNKNTNSAKSTQKGKSGFFGGGKSTSSSSSSFGG